MDKAYLEKCLHSAANNFVWNLYFFNRGRKPKNGTRPYEAHRIRFSNNAHLVSYMGEVLNAVNHFQIAPLSQVEIYNGFNTKCSCDRLAINDEIIEECFSSFRNSLTNSAEGNLKDSYHGYILEGQPQSGADGVAVTLMKFANPTAKLKGRKSTYFKKCDNNLLGEITEQFFKMYLTIDAILIEENRYVFNHAFEKVFDMEQTFQKVKAKAIQAIADSGFISNPDTFADYAQSTNARTFVTLDDERMQRAAKGDERVQIGRFSCNGER
ncbi:MAG: DUF4868 domain-containing protein [Oscillospiraceae bacterium]|nr:DUF4868 domain-containing protein [Oscillospiraceae bacterium]